MKSVSFSCRNNWFCACWRLNIRMLRRGWWSYIHHNSLHRHFAWFILALKRQWGVLFLYKNWFYNSVEWRLAVWPNSYITVWVIILIRSLPVIYSYFFLKIQQQMVLILNIWQIKGTSSHLIFCYFYFDCDGCK